VADTLDLTADLLYERWKRSVDRLWREAVHRRQAGLAGRERERSARRLKSLQRIVRKALADYHRLELERQRRREKLCRVGAALPDDVGARELLERRELPTVEERREGGLNQVSGFLRLHHE